MREAEELWEVFVVQVDGESDDEEYTSSKLLSNTSTMEFLALK